MVNHESNHKNQNPKQQFPKPKTLFWTPKFPDFMSKNGSFMTTTTCHKNHYGVS